MEIQNSVEQVGEKFNLDSFFRARELTLKTVALIQSLVVPGMSEKDGLALIKEEFEKVGVTKFWHPSKFRIVTDTTKEFRELSDTDIKTSEGELCFVDVGPIIENHEADFGRTFVVGGGFSDLAQASEIIFQKTSQVWQNQKHSGAALYDFMDAEAKGLGFQLNPKMAGHRLGDFPHKLFSSTKLAEFDQCPTRNLWVLEVHLLNLEGTRGAFFEDILM